MTIALALTGTVGCSIGHAVVSHPTYPETPTEDVSCVGRTTVALLDTAAIVFGLYTTSTDDGENLSDCDNCINYGPSGEAVGGLIAVTAGISALVGWSRFADCRDARRRYREHQSLESSAGQPAAVISAPWPLEPRSAR